MLALPSLAQTADLELAMSVERRARRLPKSIREQLFGGPYLKHRAWISKARACILIGKPSDVSAAEERAKRYEDAFPHLLGGPNDTGLVKLTNSSHIVFENIQLVPNEARHAVSLGADCSVAFFKVRIEGIGYQGTLKYTIPAVYAFGFGDMVNEQNYADYFDDFLAYTVKQRLHANL
jgi:hypothetical protein